MVCITYTFNKSVATIDVEGYNKRSHFVSHPPKVGSHLPMFTINTVLDNKLYKNVVSQASVGVTPPEKVDVIQNHLF